MKEIEIKNLNVLSFFKVALYFSIIPAVIIFLMGIILFLFGIISDETELIFIGIVYIFLPGFMAAIYGVMGMLVSFIYNFLAQRFGGVRLTFEEIKK
ncbi:MAG: hypothetical protein JXB60_03605 [Candidatus Cloacimonetes bacterium]|nr:hypothetical protein [Candidatus Cloacimonadota bacterium]